MLRPAATSPTNAALLRQLLWLSGPILLEHLLHIAVGLTDTYLANNLVPGDPDANATAAAAVGSVTYLGWLLGLFSGAFGVGATAIIARAIGAKHKRIANAGCGQALLLGATAGVVVGWPAAAFAGTVASWFNLEPAATTQAAIYIRWVGLAVPFMVTLFVANACLRGAGDTLRPALLMAIVDGLNVLVSFALVRGWFGLPQLGFAGVALGTAFSYTLGGVIALGLLFTGRSKLRLTLGRLLPNVPMAKRILRIGVPSMADGALHWGINFIVLLSVNGLGTIAAAAHNVTIRLESFSYMSGFAVATAVSTMVGQALGRRDPAEAKRAALLGYVVGGGGMTVLGLSFIFLSTTWAGWLADNQAITALSADTLWIAGFTQVGFAAYLVFAGALRGAGDTTWVMVLNLVSNFGVRLLGVLIVVGYFGLGLRAVWWVLGAELCVRGVLMFSRFASGKWAEREV
ncbi:MAG: MATE family efflux transporter [Planctomycetota bacterium]